MDEINDAPERRVQWAGTERRRSAPMTLTELEYHIDARIQQLLRDHEEKEIERFDVRFEELKKLIKSAFPNDDPSKHREYHDEQILYMREMRDMWKDVRQKTVSGLIWAAIVGVGLAVWSYVKHSIGAPPP